MTQTDPTPDARLVEREALARILRRGGWCFTSIGNSASALAFNFAVEQFRQEVEALSAIPAPDVQGGELMRARILAMEQQAFYLRTQLAAKDQEIARLQTTLGHVTDCLVDEIGDLANEDELQNEDLAATLGKDYARQIIGARLYIRQSRAACKGSAE